MSIDPLVTFGALAIWAAMLYLTLTLTGKGKLMRTHAMIGDLADALSVVLVEATDEWERSRIKDAVVWMIGEAMGPRWATLLDTTATQRVTQRQAGPSRQIIAGEVYAGACDRCGGIARARCLYLVRRLDAAQDAQVCAWCLGAESGRVTQIGGSRGDATAVN